MAREASDVLQEHVVSLVAKVDQSGMSQLLSYLDASKLKSLGMAAAVSGLTTAIYKFVSSVTKEEFALRNMTRTTHKSVEATRAQNTALKSMGMTLKEINRDKELKAIYNDIKKTNEALALPNMKDLLSNVNQLRGAFWKLKSIASYAIQWINAKILKAMEGTIKRITGGLNDISEWFTKNFQQITDKIASVLSGFLLGIDTIAQAVQHIAGLFNALPDTIKAVGGAITAIALLIKSGPIGQLLAIIEFIGQLRLDHDNYKAFMAGDMDAAGTFGLGWLWEIIDGDGDPGEKAVEVLKKVFGKITGTLRDWAGTLNDADFGGWLTGETGMIGQALTAIFDWIKGPEGRAQVIKFVKSLGAAGSAGASFMGDIAVELVSLLANALGDDGVITNGLKNNSFFTGLGSGVLTQKIVEMLTGNKPLSLISGAFAGYAAAINKSRKDALKKLAEERYGTGGIVESFSYDRLESEFGKDPRLASEIGADLGADFGSFIETILITAGRALHFTDEVLMTLIKLVIDAIYDAGKDTGEQGLIDGIKTIFDNMPSDSEEVFGSIIKGGILGLATGNLGIGILGAFIDLIVKSVEEAQAGESLWDVLGRKFESFWQTILDLWYGPWVEEDGIAGGKYRNKKLGLKYVFDKLLWGDDTPQSVSAYIRDKNNELQRNVLVKNGKGGILNWLLGYDTVEDGNEIHVLGVFEKLWADLVKNWGDFKESPVFQWISNLVSEVEKLATEALDRIWKSLYNKIGLLKFIARNPNGSQVTILDNGSVKITSDSGAEKVIEQGGITEAGLDFLSAIAPGFDIGSEQFTGSLDNLGYAFDFRTPGKAPLSLGAIVYQLLHGGSIDDSYQQYIGKDALSWLKNLNNGDISLYDYLLEQGFDLSGITGEPSEPTSGNNSGSLKALPNQPVAVIAAGGMSDGGLRLGGTSYYGRGGGGSPEETEEATETVQKYNKETKNATDTVKNSAEYIQWAAEDTEYALADMQTGVNDTTLTFDALTEYLSYTFSSALALTVNSFVAVSGTIDSVNTIIIPTFAKALFDAAEATLGFKNDLGTTSEPISTFVTNLSSTAGMFSSLAQDSKDAAKHVKDLGDKIEGMLSKIETLGSNSKTAADRVGTFSGKFNGTEGANTLLDKFLDGLKKVNDAMNNMGGGGNGEKGALGGRIGTQKNNMTVGEDGPEYIIPVTKTERAYSLIHQMLSEMGFAAINRVASDFGFGSGTVGNALMNGTSTLGSMIMNNTYNIHAPVSIVVNSSAASADDVGSAVYSMTERNLVRTLRGVYA